MMRPTSIFLSAPSGSQTAGLFAGIKALLLAVIHVLVAWQCTARERAQLAELSDAALKDVGLTRGDILAELRKPRWRR